MSRISNEELEQSITTVKAPPMSEKTKITNKGIFDLPKEVFYTLIGNHFSKDEHGNPLAESEDKALAKQVLNGTRYKYYVKIGNGGHLYNPLGLYASSEANRHNATDKHRGRPQFRFTEVSHNAFNYYIAYLRTKDTKFFKFAEREMI